MHEFAERFAQYCESSFDLTAKSEYDYQSLSVCIVDCVYSLNAKYYEHTVPVVKRYAREYMGGDSLAPGDTVSMLIQRMDEMGHPEFVERVLRNHQKLGGKNKIPKEEVTYQLARYLRDLHIETIEDFRNFESQEILEIVVRAVRGLGDAGVNYLFMLAGDPNRCKPDVHIHQCIQEVCGQDISDEACQELFADAVALLRRQHPDLTARNLDGIVWRAYHQ